MNLDQLFMADRIIIVDNSKVVSIKDNEIHRWVHDVLGGTGLVYSDRNRAELIPGDPFKNIRFIIQIARSLGAAEPGISQPHIMTIRMTGLSRN